MGLVTNKTIILYYNSLLHRLIALLRRLPLLFLHLHELLLCHLDNLHSFALRVLLLRRLRLHETLGRFVGERAVSSGQHRFCLGVGLILERFHATFVNFCLEVIVHCLLVDEVFGAVETVVLAKTSLIEIDFLIQQFVGFGFQVCVDLEVYANFDKFDENLFPAKVNEIAAIYSLHRDPFAFSSVAFVV